MTEPITARHAAPTLVDLMDAIVESRAAVETLRTERAAHDLARDKRDRERDELATERHKLLVGRIQEHESTLSTHGAQIVALQHGGTASRPLWAVVALLLGILAAIMRLR